MSDPNPTAGRGDVELRSVSNGRGGIPQRMAPAAAPGDTAGGHRRPSAIGRPPWCGDDPWAIRVDGAELERLGAVESLLALANGHIGLRGTLDEGEPRHDPGTYLNGFYEDRPLPHAEVAYGYPESGQTVVNVTDGKLIRAIVDDAPLDLRYGGVQDHERILDLRLGRLRRRTVWRSPGGATVQLCSERFVSLNRRTVAAIRYELTPLDRDVYVAVQSDLLANEPVTSAGQRDPRTAAALGAVLHGELAVARDRRAVLVHGTRRSGLRVAAGMDHHLSVPDAAECSIEAGDDLARYTVAARLPRGRSLCLVKYLAYGWSSQRSAPALRDQVEGALATAVLAGWDELAGEQSAFLQRFWRGADVEVDGDLLLQQAVRFGLFHVLQAGARNERRPIPAKGLTGPGYDGHAFWDTETYVLPVLTYTAPEAARDALQWRHTTLDQARRRAAELGQCGAAFPWRTIDGRECSGYWPAGTASFHVGADIADAVARYVAVTGDDEFDAAYGAELLVETARLWASLGHFDGDTFRIDGVTGPDEYTAVVDDNIYTNLMAQRNLREAATACARRPEVAQRLEVGEDEVAAWLAAAEAMAMPYDDQLGVHPQSEGFTQHAEWDFEATPAAHYPLLLHAPYFELYRKQVIKQADLVLAMYLRGDAFDAFDADHADGNGSGDAGEGIKARNFAYYEARTVRDSSLSACPQAIIAAEVGQSQLALDYWAETALTDLADVQGNTEGGLHLAASAGAWLVAVAGFGGMRDHDGQLTFAPRAAPGLRRLRFHLTHRRSCLQVTIDERHTTYRLLEGEPLHTAHHGRPITVGREPVVLATPAQPQPDPVRQPHGRAPRRHVPDGGDR